MEAEHAAIRQSVVKVEYLTGRLVKLDSDIEDLQAALKAMPNGADVDQLQTEAILAAGAAAEARIAINDQQNLADYSKARAAEVVAEYEQYLKQKGTLVEAWAKAKADLASLHFNNNLLKKVRSARPVIADQLWSSVLMAVSTMFSQMRGEKTVVTKDKEGFKANGQCVESLSGSTLDLLGLAIRVALIKTFLPACPFVILDEPAHGCDEDRTTSLLGFLAGAGFQQTIIVTHDDTSEAVADSLITL
jgi:DNA repair exonuclease SbcCD ATPase subunit